MHNEVIKEFNNISYYDLKNMALNNVIIINAFKLA